MNIFPKKSLGQNFLINTGVVEKILDATEILSNDLVLEVGPGEGALTEKLKERAGRVIAIEKDHRLISILENRFKTSSNIEIIEGDILKFNPSSIIHSPYKIVANLPYYITSHFLRLMLEEWPRPALAVLMVQREVAQRMLAKPPDMNMLALSVQYYADIQKVMDVSRGSFRPMPNVDSAVIKLIPKETPFSSEKTEKLFYIAGECFAGKRKQLITTLPGAIGKDKEETRMLFEKLNINPMARPETLHLEDWLNLLKELQ